MYKIARASTTRMIVDTIAQFGDAITYYEFDAHAEGFELPNTDLVGLVGFSCSQNDQFHDLSFGVAIMTVQDPSLTRSTDYVDTFYRRLAAHKKWTMFDDDGSATGFEAVAFDGVAASPMGRVDMRPTVELVVTARVTQAGMWTGQ